MRGGYVDEARLDEAVTNLMECRMKLGILGDERQEELDKIGYDQVDLASSKALNQTVSRKSFVLLKMRTISFLLTRANFIRSA